MGEQEHSRIALSGSVSDEQGSQEEWRPIAGYEGCYEVSSLGRVRSLPRYKARGRILTPAIRQNGYRFASLWRDNKGWNESVHRLVAGAFCTRLPGQDLVRHLDGDRARNHASNVAWGTASDNNFDTVRHGNHWEAKKTHCIRGHEYDEANTGYRRDGRSRYCRSCIRDDTRSRRAQEAAA